MEPKYEYSQTETAVYHTNYVRNSKAIGVLWGIFTICFAIINIVVFVQPQWIGATADSQGIGYFGLWKYCRLVQDGQDLVCTGQLNDFDTICTPAFRAATVFIGLSVLIILLCIICMLLFFFFHSSTVFHICGWMQVLSGKYLFPRNFKTLYMTRHKFCLSLEVPQVWNLRIISFRTFLHATWFPIHENVVMVLFYVSIVYLFIAIPYIHTNKNQHKIINV